MSLFRVPLSICPYWVFCLRLGRLLLGHHRRNCCLAGIGHNLVVPGPTPMSHHHISHPYQGSLVDEYTTAKELCDVWPWLVWLSGLTTGL